jgi:HD-GYP domain-containing protein (c-di-GMP phosphodiesterase class II)
MRQPDALRVIPPMQLTTPAPITATPPAVRLSEVVAALSYALDITEGQPEGHSVKSCLIGMRLADQIGLPPAQRPALFYALLLKDLGCSSNAARICRLFATDDFRFKRDSKLRDWSDFPRSALQLIGSIAPDGSPLERAARVVSLGMQGGVKAVQEIFEVRCHRGAAIATDLGFGPDTAGAIRTLDEHWDGRGSPEGLRGAAIPLLGRILCIAQTVEIFASSLGVEPARTMARERRGTWFDPALVDALEPLWEDRALWASLAGDAREALEAYSPDDRTLAAGDQLLDQLAEAFAQVIDAKSPWTFAHSTGVADKAVGIGTVLGLTPTELRDLRRAALLHDIGKLGVSSLILDKPGRLTPDEIAEMRKHAVYTRRILERVGSFSDLAYVASLHHERMDGRGYPYGLRGDELPLAARILAAADFCDALCAARPYRPASPWSEARRIMEREVGSGLDGEVFAALCAFMEGR